ncbi:hypothetical protein CAEBREN_02081 [Caenorhabditis brenneri]|uniref:G-protein coupled receptors family 1 profile domain-containing protein n=1 Tax=Caenorhabditis brenneri TaxID=135651 RepID=G0MUC5_CAEBE|nr:hypothetical protein CAEBREN_02081 [Caenorhabditis brenneri]
MKQNSKKKTTTADPFYYSEDFYIYGARGESNFYDHDWLFEDSKNHIDEFLAIIEVLTQVYQVACFVSFFINFIHLFILTRKELRSNIVFIVMTAICICDIFYSLGNIIQLLMTWNIFYKIEACDEGLKYSHQIVDIASKAMQIMNRQTSGVLVFLIAAFRAFSVVHPMSNITNTLMRPKTGLSVVLIAVIISGVWSLIYFFQAQFYLKKILYCTDNDKLPTYIPWEFPKNQKWETKYLFIDGCTTIVISVLYVLVTVILVGALITNRKRRKILRKEDKAFFENLNYGALTLLIFNSIFHVIICFLMSSQYRETVRGLVCGQKKEKPMIAILENTVNSVRETSKVSESSRKRF